MAMNNAESMFADTKGQASADSRKSRPPVRDRIIELRRVRAGDLGPHPNNYRLHSGEQRATLRAALDEIGHADALIAMKLPDGRLMLINGHMRADIDRDACVPVLILDVTPEEADKLLLLMDPLAEMAQRDADRIKELLAKVQTQSETLRDLFRRTAGERVWQMVHPDDVREANVSPDRAAALQRKWQTAPDQLWGAGPNRIKIGDSTDEKVVADLWRGSVARIRTNWCDPAYGCSYSDKNQFLNAIDRGNRIQRPIANDHSPEQAPLVFSAALKLSLRYAEIAASAYATVPGGPLLPKFIAAFEGVTFSPDYQVTRQACHKAFQRALGREPALEIEEFRKLDTARCEEMLLNLQPAIRKGHVRSIEAGIKVLEHITKVNGYAAPNKHELTGKDGKPLTLVQLLNAIGPIEDED
jgi:hypothetical protein